MYWQIIIICTLLAMIIPASRARLRYFAAYLIYAVVVMTGSLVCSVQFYFKGEPSYENSWLVLPISLIRLVLVNLQNFTRWLVLLLDFDHGSLVWRPMIPTSNISM